MKEIKTKRTIEEVIGYESSDGRRFNSKDECKKYEETAKAVIFNDFKRLMKCEPFSENTIWQDYGYGSEDFMLTIIEIKNVDDLHVANMFAEAYKYCDRFTTDEIGKGRLLINLGYYGTYGDCGFYPRTLDKVVESFARNLTQFFFPEMKEGDSSDNT